MKTIITVLASIGLVCVFCFIVLIIGMAVIAWKDRRREQKAERWLKGQELRERDVDPPTFVKFSPPEARH